MSPDTTAVLCAATMIAANGLELLTSWLRNRWQVQREREHHRDLIAMAQALPEWGQIREHRSDGTWTRLPVTPDGQGHRG